MRLADIADWHRGKLRELSSTVPHSVALLCLHSVSACFLKGCQKAAFPIVPICLLYSLASVLSSPTALVVYPLK